MVFRQGIPSLNLFIEKDTDNVPADGKYHLLHNGAVIASSRILKTIQKKYCEIVAANSEPEKDVSPEQESPKDAKELILKDMDSRYMWIGDSKRPRKRPTCRTFR
ncbi:MAG: hypothetical protein AB1546_08350 [bacterium]